ncbi:MAG TPA: pyridoxal-phosphate dependent enzyme [Nitrososphaera sp.]|jgi:threonine synthase|nr:pyridoxal-phosphate dependent enzyme [Nitrososphaera sp.]
MAASAIKKCINPTCGKTYEIRSDIYRCSCGSLLDIVYGNRLPRDLIDKFYQRRNHGGNIYNESGVWRFRDLINFAGIDTEDFDQCARSLVSLDGAEGRLSKPYKMSKVADYAGMAHDSLLLQPEGYNPSGSFKDNGMATAVTHAKSLGVKRIVCASTGNTSASAAMYAANEDVECDVYIPKGEIAPGKLGQAFQFGAQVIQVQGNFDDALAASLKNAKETGGYTVNSVNPFRLEGQKTIVYRVMEQLDWNPPDWIVYPGGALGNTSSCGKCLMELYDWGWIKKIPRLAVVNAKGANTLFELYNGLFEGKKLDWNGGSPDLGMVERYYAHLDKAGIKPKTHATAIQIGRPANIAKALRALHITNGVVIQVEDRDMADGMSVVGLNGFDCEMASGAVPAGIKQLHEAGIMKRDDIVVGILTGRQKDAGLAVEYHLNESNRFARPPKNR